jgi:antitoxin YefM
LTRSAAPSPVFKDGVRKRGSGSTLSKPWPSGRGVEGLTLRTFSCTLKFEVIHMTTIKATEARANLYKLLDQAGESHEPIQITGKRSNAILISEDDWRAIQETLYLLSIPGMRESIRKGLKTPVKKCSEKPGW